MTWECDDVTKTGLAAQLAELGVEIAQGFFGFGRADAIFSKKFDPDRQVLVIEREHSAHFSAVLVHRKRHAGRYGFANIPKLRSASAQPFGAAAAGLGVHIVTEARAYKDNKISFVVEASILNHREGWRGGVRRKAESIHQPGGENALIPGFSLLGHSGRFIVLVVISQITLSRGPLDRPENSLLEVSSTLSGRSPYGEIIRASVLILRPHFTNGLCCPRRGVIAEFGV